MNTRKWFYGVPNVYVFRPNEAIIEMEDMINQNNGMIEGQEDALEMVQDLHSYFREFKKLQPNILNSFLPRLTEIFEKVIDLKLQEGIISNFSTFGSYWDSLTEPVNNHNHVPHIQYVDDARFEQYNNVMTQTFEHIRSLPGTLSIDQKSRLIHNLKFMIDIME